MKGKERKYQKGITLIALVLTIIILLILAGVTISIVFNGGIINKSQTAVDSYHIQEDKEKIELAKTEVSFNNLGKIPVEELKETLIKYKFTICDEETEFDGEPLTDKQFVVKCPNKKHTYLVIAEKINIEETIPTIESISVENGEINLFDDKTTTFTANITGKDYTVQWYYENEAIEGATDKTYSIATTEMNEKTYLGGTYKCVVTYKEESIEKEVNQTVEYTISSAEQMSNFAKRVNNQGITFATLKDNGGEVSQIANIDLSSVCSASNGNWTPIGDYATGTNKYFAGTFNGNSNTISNLYINSANDYQGLFGYVTNCNIQNINMEEVDILGIGSIGGLIGCGYQSNIINIHIKSGNINGMTIIGGIAGMIYNKSTISKCSNYAKVSSISTEYAEPPNNGAVGGIGGVTHPNTKVELCANYGTISGQRYIGGINGVNYSKTLNCYNVGTIKPTLEQDSIGGIAGIQNSTELTGSIENCYNIGKIEYIPNVGAYGQIIASPFTGTVSNCYYLEGQNDIKGVYNQDIIGQAEAKTETYMKSSEFVNLLGNSYWKLVSGKNKGYPIFNWQDKE